MIHDYGDVEGWSNGQVKFGRRKGDGALLSCGLLKGGLAQLARAPALQAGGQRFESVILHFMQSIIHN